MRRHAVARLEPDARLQVAEVVVREGYWPPTIKARSGVPLRIVFHRNDDDQCSERVVFSDPHLDRRLVAAGSTTVDLPAREPGEIRFTCGMGRYRGRIEITPAGGSLLTRLRGEAARLDPALGTAIVLWTCLLPLIAVAAVLLLDLRSALVAAGIASAVWLAGCLWAFRWSQQRA